MAQEWDEEKIWVPERNQTHDLKNTRQPLHPLSYDKLIGSKTIYWVHMC